MKHSEGFFEKYQEFFKTSKTIPSHSRLNSRYSALIKNNIEIIKQSVILDIASHDGRWSFAAIKNGAKNVLGIEGRSELVQSSNSNMKKYGIPEDKYDFVTGDIFNEIKKIKQNTIDVVFCFGYLYHTINHMLLFEEIKRLNPNYLILDTAISDSEYCVIEVREEDSTDPRNAIKDTASHNNKVVIGLPSKKALELMLTNLGFDFQYYNWHDGIIQNWEDIEDYKNHRRVSLVAKNLQIN